MILHAKAPTFWLFISLLACLSTVQCHSRRSPPFTKAFTPSNPSIRILETDYSHFEHRPRTLQTADISYDDTFLLQFTLLDDTQHQSTSEQVIAILFQPNTHLLHHQARINHSGEVQPLQRHHFRAYHGTVLHSGDVEYAWAQTVAGIRELDTDHGARGWASLLLRQDGAWDGSAIIDGEPFHFRPTHVYERERSPLSPEVPMPALVRRGKLGGSTVILRSRDTMTAEQEHAALRSRGLDSSLATQSLHDDSAASCSHDSLDFNLQSMDRFAFLSSFERAAYLKRSYPPYHEKRQDIQGSNSSSSFTGSIGSTSGCPKEQKVLFVGVAADCTVTQSFGSIDETKQSILSYISSVSVLYAKTFNISVGVVEMQVMPANCPSTATSSEPWNIGCSSSPNAPDLNARLSLFSQWRSDKGSSDGAGLWHLLTTCNSGSEVGVAWLGQVCTVAASTSQGSTSSGTAVTALTDRTWQVIAHEQGHSLGAIHDCDQACSATTNGFSANGVACCPLSTSSCNAQSNFIMSPVSSKDTTAFSPCTVGNVCSLFASGLDTSCFEEPGQRATLSAQQCGNGILEPGEECDPGPEGSTACCDPQTCKLRSNAVCDPTSSGCCTEQCQFASSSVQCRPSVNSDCDPAEFCSGSSATCATDVHAKNGIGCGGDNSGLQCAGGLCTSRDQQCRQQGSGLNITRACSASTDSCQVTCANPRDSSSCVVLGGTFSDGLPCGLGGTCSNGNCKRGNVANSIKSWIDQNPGIAYPVLVVGSIIVLIILVGLIRCCCVRRKARNVAPSAAYLQNKQARKHRRNRKTPPSNTQSRPRSTAAAPILATRDSDQSAAASNPRGSWNSLANAQPAMQEVQLPQTIYSPPPGAPPPRLPPQQSLVVPGAPTLPPSLHQANSNRSLSPSPHREQGQPQSTHTECNCRHSVCPWKIMKETIQCV